MLCFGHIRIRVADRCIRGNPSLNLPLHPSRGVWQVTNILFIRLYSLPPLVALSQTVDAEKPTPARPLVRLLLITLLVWQHWPSPSRILLLLLLCPALTLAASCGHFRRQNRLGGEFTAGCPARCLQTAVCEAGIMGHHAESAEGSNECECWAISLAYNLTPYAVRWILFTYITGMWSVATAGGLCRSGAERRGSPNGPPRGCVSCLSARPQSSAKLHRHRTHMSKPFSTHTPSFHLIFAAGQRSNIRGLTGWTHGGEKNQQDKIKIQQGD